jgi:hypothetical protein
MPQKKEKINKEANIKKKTTADT